MKANESQTFLSDLAEAISLGPDHLDWWNLGKTMVDFQVSTLPGSARLEDKSLLICAPHTCHRYFKE